jgi:hypothetical protein
MISPFIAVYFKIVGQFGAGQLDAKATDPECHRQALLHASSHVSRSIRKAGSRGDKSGLT